MTRKFFDTQTTIEENIYWKFVTPLIILWFFAWFFAFIFSKIININFNLDIAYFVLLFFFFVNCIFGFIYGVIIIQRKGCYLYWLSKTVKGKYAIFVGIVNIILSIIFASGIFILFYFKYLR